MQTDIRIGEWRDARGEVFKDKVPVFGLIGRNGDLVAKVVSGTGSSKLLPIIRKYVEEGSTIYTDGWDYGEVFQKCTTKYL